jgi:hypothetical protein
MKERAASTESREFVPLAELRDKLGLARSTLRRRLSRAGVQRYCSPLDERSVLVRRADVDELLLRPRPMPTRTTDVAA